MNPPALTAFYRRVSTDHQDDSLELQEKRSGDYAQYKGLTPREDLTYADPDTSGTIPLLDRPGGRAMMNRLKHGDVKHLVIAKLDRLGRNTRDFLATIETLSQLGVTLHIADFGGDSISTQGHWGKMILTILAAVAEAEVGEIRDRTVKIMRQKFDRGELTGNVPYGFDCQYTFQNGETLLSPRALSADALAPHTRTKGPVRAKDLLANEAEQQTLRFMDKWRASGLTLKAIAHKLNLAGIPPKLGPAWQIGNVDSVLKSRHTALILSASTNDNSLAA